MSNVTAEFNFGANRNSAGIIVTPNSDLVKGSHLNPSEFNGTNPIAVDDPDGVESNVDNGTASRTQAFKNYMGKENIPLKASLNGMV